MSDKQTDEVRRYNMEVRAPDYTDMFRRPNGMYVKYEDYAALQTRIRELEALAGRNTVRMAELRKHVRHHPRCAWDKYGGHVRDENKVCICGASAALGKEG